MVRPGHPLHLPSVALAVLLVTAGAGVPACRPAEQRQTQSTGQQVAPPDTTGAAVWAHLGAAEYRNNWQVWPGKGRLYRGQEPHGMLLTTYLNAAALGAVNAKAGVFPPGAVIVKENYMPDSTLAAITTMVKVPGYNPETADWYWVKHAPDGSVDGDGMAQGRVPMCIGCHAAQQANDYVFTGPVR